MFKQLSHHFISDCIVR